MFKNTSVVILAAGKGSRFSSDVPKPLHVFAGKPIIQHVIDTSINFGAQKIYVIYGYQGDVIKLKFKEYRNINWVLQKEQLGTGDALKQVIPFISDDENILILYGDVPLISVATLQKLEKIKPTLGIGLLTGKLSNPSGYGRIIRKNGLVMRIIEEEEASIKEINIKEVNSGIFLVNGSDLKRLLLKLKKNNMNKELYLTSLIEIAQHEGYCIQTTSPINIYEIYGINNHLQLSQLEKIYQKKQAKMLLLSGVMLRDPERFDLRGILKHGRDVEIDTNVILEGTIELGDRVKIGTGCLIKNSIIADDCVIYPYTVIQDSHLSSHCTVGPFSHLRFGCNLDQRVHIGNFVEIKKASIGPSSKAKHLSYLGNIKIGNKVNIGAGTITCNYDGANKLDTIVGDNVFIGADSQLIAPVKINNDATIAAGTTIIKDVLTPSLIYNPKAQHEKIDWKRPKKKK